MSGNIYTNGTNATLNQLIVDKINDPNVEFCSIKPNHLNLISPGACKFTDNNNIQLIELQSCFIKNPCLIGTLAFTPNDSSNFNLSKNDKSALTNSIVSCVTTKGKTKCDYGYVPIWNKNIEEIECYYTGFD